MNRERLEALTDEALRKLAALEGLDVPDDVERILLIDAILEVLEEKQEEQELQNNNLMQVSQKKYDLTLLDIESTSEENIETMLPLSYHETKIQFLLRDPYWAYVYWDVKGGSLSALKRELEAENIVLRVLRYRGLPKGEQYSSAEVVDSFDIDLGCKDYSWYVNLPVQDTYYSVALVFTSKQQEFIVSQSDVQYVPPVYSFEELLSSPDLKQNSLYLLMELEKLDILYTKPTKPDRLGLSDEALQSL
ncbi:MAG: DUF4912 domain-containing protein [Spirochaetes bacterium]|nr:DUF4912 domain-containing protein [Spirochaetota bacterium]